MQYLPKEKTELGTPEPIDVARLYELRRKHPRRDIDLLTYGKSLEARTIRDELKDIEKEYADVASSKVGKVLCVGELIKNDTAEEEVKAFNLERALKGSSIKVLRRESVEIERPDVTKPTPSCAFGDPSGNMPAIQDNLKELTLEEVISATSATSDSAKAVNSEDSTQTEQKTI
jgi:hypothetical protein